MRIDAKAELKKRDRAIRLAWMRLAAMNLTSSPKRFMEFLQEATIILGKQHRRAFELAHEKKKAGRRIRSAGQEGRDGK